MEQKMKIINKRLTLLIILISIVYACNLSSRTAQTQKTQIITKTIESQLLPTRNIIVNTATIQQSPTMTNTKEIITTLPIIELEGGNGYIFFNKTITHDDRDIWWNAVQFVPVSSNRMVSLGIIENPSEVKNSVFNSAKGGSYEAKVGEGFGVEISRNNEIKYAIIRVIKIDDKRKITFDWIYPFEGSVKINP
jgi:hypothetical protein